MHAAVERQSYCLPPYLARVMLAQGREWRGLRPVLDRLNWPADFAPIDG